MFSAVFFLCFTQYGGLSHHLNFGKFHDTAPLREKKTVITTVKDVWMSEPNCHEISLDEIHWKIE